MSEQRIEIKQKNYGTLELVDEEKDVVKLWMFEMLGNSELIFIEKKNIPALISALIKVSNEYKK